MYLLPGYVKHYEKSGAIYVMSQLLQNEIKIKTEELKREFLIW